MTSLHPKKSGCRPRRHAAGAHITGCAAMAIAVAALGSFTTIARNDLVGPVSATISGRCKQVLIARRSLCALRVDS